jgi:2-dehydro-3-deoxygluconokinase
MSRIVTFGEIMLRLSPPGDLRIEQAASFAASYGGGEANVALSLAQFGHDATFVTRLPANPIGDACRNELRRYGVDVSRIVRGGGRMGIYFYEKGASVRASKVVYDRAGSAIATACRDDFDWEEILDGADWFHFTGITPALGDNVAAIAMDAVRTAREKNIPVSCDLNYRRNLWAAEKAGLVMAEFMPFVTVLIANEEDAGSVFGIRAEQTDIARGNLSAEGYRQVADRLILRFGFQKVAVTLRESFSASENGWSALVCDGAECWHSSGISFIWWTGWAR